MGAAASTIDSSSLLSSDESIRQITDVMSDLLLRNPEKFEEVIAGARQLAKAKSERRQWEEKSGR